MTKIFRHNTLEILININMKKTNFYTHILKAGLYAFVLGALFMSSCKEDLKPEDTTSPEAAFTYAADELVVTFTNTSKGASTFAWDFGNGETSTEAGVETPIVITYTSEDTYEVKLSVTRDNGKTDEIKRLITLRKTPVADFTATSVGRTTTFTNESANAETYEWNFGDGTALSSEANPVHVFPDNDTYTVKLVAVKGALREEIEKEVTVLGPWAGYEYSVSDKTVTFTNTSTDATSYAWDFGDGSSTSTDTDPVKTYTDYGLYDVKLKAIADDGAIDSIIMEVPVVIPPEADFTYTGTGLSFTYTNASTGATGYVWDFGDGNTSTDENPTHTYDAAGNYMVSLVASNDYDMSDTDREWYGVHGTDAAYATFINGDIDGYGDGAEKQTNNDMWEKPDHWTGFSDFRAGGISSDGKKLDDGTKTLGLKMKNNNTRGAYQEVVVETGQSYTVTFDIAGDEVAGTNVRMDVYVLPARIYGEADAGLANAYEHFAVLDSDLTGKGNFTTMSTTFTATSDVVTFYMLETVHTFDGDTEVWVDNITLVKN